METEDIRLTQAPIDLPWYPISLSAISAKVAKRNGRRKRPEHHAQQPVDNVKKIVNPFGEEIVQVDGDIPVELPVNDGDRFLFISGVTLECRSLSQWKRKIFVSHKPQ